MKVVILAGGFGTRLKSEIRDIPKPMAPINNRPFLEYLFDYLINQNLENVILSVFYNYESIINRYGHKYNNLNLEYSIDKSKLGTGGAIKAALKMSKTENAFIINGDTFFGINFEKLYNVHINYSYDLTIASKEMKNFDRYGIIQTDKNGKVTEIKEKKYCKKGYIDGGIYLIKRSFFDSQKMNERFSLNDYLSKNLNTKSIGSCHFNSPFIDIGTPEDYNKAKIFFNNYL